MKLPLEVNSTVLTWVAEQMGREPRELRAHRRVRPVALRCHPELHDRLRSLAHGLHGVHAVYLEGLAVLVHPALVVFAVAGGADWMALRLPVHGHGAVIRSGKGRRGLGGEWIDVDPWLTDHEIQEGTLRARGWVRVAYQHAGDLTRQRRPGRPDLLGQSPGP